jgi:hypothetical protein
LAVSGIAIRAFSKVQHDARGRTSDLSSQILVAPHDRRQNRADLAHQPDRELVRNE